MPGSPEQQRQTVPETRQQQQQEAPQNPESPEYREWLRRKIERLETELKTIAGRSNLMEALPELAKGAKGAGKEWYKRYCELVTARLELFLLSPEEKQTLEKEYDAVEGTFDPAISKKIRDIFALFEFGRPKKGVPTSQLLRNYKGGDRIWVWKINEKVKMLEELIPIATPQQQAFLQHLKATLVRVMEMDPIAKKELELKHPPTEKGWSRTGIAFRAMAFTAVSALALFSFIVNKFKLGYTSAAYAGAAYLIANGVPKGKVEKIVQQCTALQGQINKFEITMGPDRKKIEAEYFRTDPKGWNELTSDLMAPTGKRLFKQLERTLADKKKTPEQKNEAEKQFLQDIAGNDQILAQRQLKGMQREERLKLCRIFLSVSDSGAQEVTRQYFENLGGGQNTAPQIPAAAPKPQAQPQAQQKPPPAPKVGNAPRQI